MIEGSASRATCLDDDRLLLLFEGKLDAAARAEVEEHLDGCEACRRLVAAATVADEGDPGERMLGRGASIGRYLVLSLIGRGGMGKVYAAYDPELDRRVALKLLHTARRSEGARRLLMREARALGKLSHPNVVQVHDVGEHRGDVFVAMELVDGQSLDAWCRRSPKPGWREVLGAYLDAARGLSGAHAKGLVHRDVKPSNILRGEDGRVRVADFGLAAGRDPFARPAGGPAPPAPVEVPGEASPVSETMPARAGSSGPLDDRLTETGALLGTPRYMAPEQHEGSRVTAASDQYSLCAALYEGLYGEPPFGIERIATDLAAILAAKRAGVPASPPPGTPVPAWIYKALARGLAPAPEGRYPSMEALIAALSEDPDARRQARRRNAGVAAAAAVLLALAVAGWAESGAFRDPCAHLERQLSGVWDEGVAGRVRAAFLGTGRAHAEGTVTRVVARLDAYGAAWAVMRGEVCSESRGAPQRRESLGLRDACLDRRRGQMQALTTLFAEKPDPEVLDKAVGAAAGLAPIAYCADTEALAARVRPPEDPALRARVTALQPRADRLETLHAAGKYREGLALGELLLAETAAVPYPPLRARVEYWMGRLRDADGDYPRAKTLLEDAAVSAAQGKDDILVATAWAQLLFVVGEHQQRLEEASVIRALGRVAMARVQDERTLAAWLNVEGSVADDMGEHAEARVLYERSLALREKVLGADHPDVATTLSNLGNLLGTVGDYPAARAMHERVLALRVKALGPDHPDVAIGLNNLAINLLSVGEYAQAKAMQEHVLAILGKSFGPEHPFIANSINNLAVVLFAMGDYPQALAKYEQAVTLREKALGPDHPDVAYALAGEGRALARLGQLDAALPLLERSRAMLEKTVSATHCDVAEPLLYLGELSLARRQPEQALPLLERALALDDAEFTSEIQLTLAEALWQLGHDRPRARSLAEEARAAYQRLGHRPGLDRATRWLADHPG